MIKFGRDIRALTLSRLAGEQSGELSKSFARLSSGLRINTASDDAASLALATDLLSNAKGLRVGTRNINDAISALNIAESAAGELQSITSRIQELAQTAANSVYTEAQRQTLDTEAQALVSEFGRIVSTTSFNGIGLLDGSVTNLDVQTGAGQGSNINLILASLSGVFASGPGAAEPNGNFALSSVIDTRTVISSGDLNGDGITDLISTGFDNSRVYIGNGDGTFSASTTILTGDFVTGAVIGDFTGDGEIDFISGGLGNINIFTGDGTGNFTLSGTIALGPLGYPWDLDAVDMNNDSIADLVVRTDFGTAVHLGTGSGTFGAAIVNVAGGAYSGSEIADLNGDGNLDVVQGQTGLPHYVNVLLGNGDGTLTAAVSYYAFPVPRSTTIFDATGDGIVDIVASSGFSYLNVLAGNGDGTFQGATQIAMPNPTFQVEHAEVTGDGITDIIATATNEVYVLKGNGDGTFSVFTTLNTPGSGGYGGVYAENALYVQDYSGDGLLDLIFGTASGLTLYVGDGTPAPTGAVIDLSDVDSARASITAIETVAASVSSRLGTIGSQISRLSTAVNINSTLSGVYEESYQRIVSLDVAQEVAKMIRLQVLQQTSTALLAQTNLEASLVLKLLT